MKKLIHPVAGTVALLTIATLWLSTVLTELAGTEQAIIAVKTAIPWGFLLLVPALAATGGTGFSMAGGRTTGLIGAKSKRMRLIAANGLLILVPSALFLAVKASGGEFDVAFYAVQSLELTAGAANLVLIGQNMRDGMRLAGHSRRCRSVAR